MLGPSFQRLQPEARTETDILYLVSDMNKKNKKEVPSWKARLTEDLWLKRVMLIFAN